MSSKYVDVITSSVSMNGKSLSGDMVDVYRDSNSTIIVFIDGMGHGVMAHMSAKFAMARIMARLKSGHTIRNTFYNEIARSENKDQKSRMHSYYTLLRITNDGMVTILSYGMPKSFFINSNYVNLLKYSSVKYIKGEVLEGSSSLENGEGILIISDGITAAGLGTKYKLGWGEENISEYITELLSTNTNLKEIPEILLEQTKHEWGDKRGDDCTVTLAYVRESKVVNLFTGCPKEKYNDHIVCKNFLREPGVHIVAGGSTAKLIARELNEELVVKADTNDLDVPIFYSIKGIDLVTEGIYTLNQLYNILDNYNEIDEYDNDPLYVFLRYIMEADAINIYLGLAENPANKKIVFRKKGILEREEIIPMLVDKLKQLGKMIVIHEM